MLSRKEIINFLEEKLNIKNFDGIFKENKLQILEEIIVAFQQNIPFSNINHISKRFEDRSTPTFEESIELVLSGKGGLCLTLCVVLHYIITKLGFKAYTTLGTVVGSDPNTHALCIVKHLTNENSLHLVDCNFGFASFHAISLTFEKESKTYEECCFAYKYTKDKNGVFDRMFRKLSSTEWRLAYSFKVEPEETYKSLEESIGTGIYTKELSVFNRGPRLVTFKNNKMVALKHDVLLIENENNVLDALKFDGNDKMLIDEALKYFPTINREELNLAFSIWRDVGSPGYIF